MKRIFEEEQKNQDYQEGESVPESLYDALRAYAASDVYPFHMPGHKRRLGGMCDPFEIDITEVEGFDDLHHAQGILLEAQERAAKYYDSDKTWFLVNGSTAGILAAISAAAAADRSRRKILLARNSHRSAYHAVYLNGLEPVYLYPHREVESEADRYASDIGVNGRILPEQVDHLLEQHPDACAVFLTSPTYDGVVSNIRELADIAHRHGTMLIVDSAHGAHFGIHPLLPLNAVKEGADFVVHSVHKTLPSLTQTALLHLNGAMADAQLVSRFLDIYQTSSPSYVFMAGIDRCISFLEKEGEQLFDELLCRLEHLYHTAEAFPGIRLIRTDDPTRILISAGGRLSGKAICDILRTEFHIEPEMEAPGYVLCLAGAGDDAEGLSRLEEALERISRIVCSLAEDRDQTEGEAGADQGNACFLSESKGVARRMTKTLKMPVPPRSVCSLGEAWEAPWQELAMEESAGKTCAEFVFLYPPGIPILTPGEQITGEILEYLLWCRASGFSLHGMADYSMEKIRVL